MVDYSGTQINGKHEINKENTRIQDYCWQMEITVEPEWVKTLREICEN